MNKYNLSIVHLYCYYFKFTETLIKMKAWKILNDFSSLLFSTVHTEFMSSRLSYIIQAVSSSKTFPALTVFRNHGEMSSPVCSLCNSTQRYLHWHFRSRAGALSSWAACSALSGRAGRELQNVITSSTELQLSENTRRTISVWPENDHVWLRHIDESKKRKEKPRCVNKCRVTLCVFVCTHLWTLCQRLYIVVLVRCFNVNISPQKV